MKSSKLTDLLEGDVKIVEKKKLWFTISAAVVAIALIMCLLFAFVADSAINVGMDFAGGYAVTVKFTALNEENFDEYVEEIDNVFVNLTDENGDEYGLKAWKYRRLGDSSSSAAIYVNYKKVKGFSEEKMEVVNERLLEELNNLVIRIIPSSVDMTNNVITYDRTMSDFQSVIITQISEAFPSATLTWLDANAGTEGAKTYTKLSFNNLGANVSKSELENAASILDSYSGQITTPSMISGSVSSDFINYAVAAALVAFILILAYTAIRFRSLSTAIATMCGILISMLLTFCLMLIFHVEIAVSFVAALLIVLCSVTGNTMLLFGRIRENRKKLTTETSASQLSNDAIKQTLPRSIFYLISSIIVVGVIGILCAIVGIMDMLVFALPIIFGLIVSVFVSLFIIPSIWTLFKKTVQKTKQTVTKKKEITTI